MTTDYKYVSYKVDTVNYDKENIKSKIYKCNDVSYQILNNNSSTIQPNEVMDSTTSLYRSVVVNPDNGKILCFSPPNSIPFLLSKRVIRLLVMQMSWQMKSSKEL